MKKEELFEVIEDIDNKYLETADTFKPKKKRNIWVIGLAAATCMMLIFGVTIIKSVTPSNFVAVYASEFGSDERLVLSEEFSQIAEYRVTQSSVPALCLNVDTTYEISEISASVSGAGQLVKYEVDENDTWHVIESGSSLIFQGKDAIYWRPTSSSDGAELTLIVYSSGELKDVIKVIIKPNDSCTGYVALMTKN